MRILSAQEMLAIIISVSIIPHQFDLRVIFFREFLEFRVIMSGMKYMTLF